MIAIGLSVRFGLKEYFTQNKLARGEAVVGTTDPLDLPCFPGIVPLYVVGVVTHSWIAAWVAFAIGMALVYLGCGMLIDYGRWRG
jgi:hypothetical protein